jgi:uracil-DNA glycosylase
MRLTCDKCSNFGLGFYSTNIQPHEYIEGKSNADIWIIGLNPKGSVGNIEQRTVADFENFDPDCHSYFHDFRKVSQRLYRNWKSEKSRIAHTDLVKCFSPSFPPQIINDYKKKAIKVETIIQNCKIHLLLQLNKSRPKVVICNGSNVEHSFWVVLSGFIGRIKIVTLQKIWI